jgi:hypothetical protein
MSKRPLAVHVRIEEGTHTEKLELDIDATVSDLDAVFRRLPGFVSAGNVTFVIAGRLASAGDRL